MTLRDSARKDVEPFLKDHSSLQIWSTEYFIQLVDFLIEKESLTESEVG